MDQETNKKAPVHIREFDDSGEQYVLHPEDNDLFTRTGRQIIEACQLGISIQVWYHELNSMMEKVHQWAKDRKGQVRACHAAPRGSGICLFFVPSTDSFDFDLADGLALLNRELVNEFNIGMVEIQQVPKAELDRFISPDSSRPVYSDATIAHHPVES